MSHSPTSKMRLISWNCKGAFHRKLPNMEALHPDVLVVPECEKPKSFTQSFDAKPFRSMKWFGDDENKGLGAFSFGEYSLEVHPAYDPSLQWIVPIRVSGPMAFTLLAVWTIPQVDAKQSKYVRPLLDAIDTYADIMTRENVIWAGDFNANYFLDKSGANKFSDFVKILSERGIHSIYHESRQCAHGDEPEDTFFMHHKEEKGFHLDYIFADSAMRSREPSLEVGKYLDWSKLSDHVPLILDIQ